MASSTLVIFFGFLLLSLSIGKIYEPCELAEELVFKLNFIKSDIANWICLVRWESNFDTGAIGKLNSDGSLDHGLFQISDLFWCENGKVDGACGIDCKDLENENIKDDAICAKRIFRITKRRTGNGFDAWIGWKEHCQHGNVEEYVANCNLTNFT